MTLRTLSIYLEAWVLCFPQEVVLVGVGSRTFQTYLCDSCGREIITDEGTVVDGYYIEVLRVQHGEQISSQNIYACSATCVASAIHDGLRREALPEQEKLTATQELWLKGQKFNTRPNIPIVDATDHTRVIGTAQEIAAYQPSTSSSRRRPQDSLDPDWEPTFIPPREKP